MRSAPPSGQTEPPWIARWMSPQRGTATPQLRIRGSRLRAAAADVLQAERDQLPRLSLSGQIGVAHSRSVGLSASGSTWSLGPLALTLPLWDGGARAAQQRAAQAAYDSLRTQLEAQVRGAVRDVEQALLALQASQDRRADAQMAVDGFDTALRATQARQRGGVASLFELEDARRQAVAARNVLIELDQQRALAAVSLVRALGGGWRADDAPAPSDPMPASATAGAGLTTR